MLQKVIYGYRDNQKKKDKSMEKIPAPPMMSWKESLGSWDAFHKAAEKSVGRKLKKVTVRFELL